MYLLSALAVAGGLVLAGTAHAAVHGDGAEGSIMGPVAFLWPDDRPWDDSDDNIGPCGSAYGVGNRTEFPISQGSVALSIGDEAYQVAFYIAFTNTPTTQSQFREQVVGNVTEVIPGHQCYKLEDLPDSVSAGTNATIQLEYWSTYEDENNGNNQTFYACADITFVNDSDFTGQIPCFNVTVEDFMGSSSSSAAAATATATGTATTPASAAATATSGVSSTSSSKSSSGLSAGAKAGIAVGSIVGGIMLIVAAIFVYQRKRRSGYLDRRRASKLNNQIQLDKLGGAAAP